MVSAPFDSAKSLDQKQYKLSCPILLEYVTGQRSYFSVCFDLTTKAHDVQQTVMQSKHMLSESMQICIFVNILRSIEKMNAKQTDRKEID